MQGSVQERGMNAEALGLLCLLLGQGHLGVDLLAVSPGRGETLEGGAVFEPVLGEAVVEVVDLERLGALGRPHIE